jgi:nucleoside-diphosphate-sugar epimerase
MQTILGSGGIIANELAKTLHDKYTKEIRLVARNPKKCHSEDELFPADLTDPKQTSLAVQGSEVAYLTIGLPYKAKEWSRLWPVVMNNVIQACSEHNCKLVFFDNVYMYDRDHFARMNENTPIRPTSKKGEVRKNIADRLLNAIEAKEVTGLIARCADYYGPDIERNSMLNETVVANLAKGKAAQWIGPLECKHSFTYTIDAAVGTAILGNSPEAFGEVWHLPTKSQPLTAQEWLNSIAGYFGTTPKAQILTPTLATILGIFIPVLKEVKEMMYQYDRDYIFDSSKFEKHFNFQPTSYEEGIKTMLETDYPKN